MKNLLKLDIKTILIGVLIIVIVLLRSCGSKTITTPKDTIKIDGEKYEIIKHDVDTFYKTKDTIVYRQGKDIHHDTTIYVPIPTDVPIDTLQILRDFYAKNVYRDTLKLNDSLGFIEINDIISQNKIYSRSYDSKIRERTIKETLIVKTLPKTQLYLGLNGGFTKQQIVQSVSINGLLKTKKDKIYELGIGLSNNGNNTSLTPIIYGGLFWKINFKK